MNYRLDFWKQPALANTNLSKIRKLYVSALRLDSLLEEKLLKEGIDSQTANSSYNFKLNEDSEIKRMIQDGIISQHEYDTYVKLNNENNTDNLGYAFVTYSITVS